MIYLTTGANGAGKTLCTLEDVRAQQLKENRPVYFHGFDMDEAVQAEFGWHKCEDPRKWMELPEGSICLFDECQNEFGKGPAGHVPKHILDMAQFRRKRGIDMWLITPHPTMLHVDVRRLIESPSWHRHFKRAFGADVVSVLKFNSPNLKCEEPGAGETGEVSMRPYPKHVYKWYRSASLHTGKRKVPRAVYVLGAAAVAVPLLAYFAWQSLSTIGDPDRVTQRVLGKPADQARAPGGAPGRAVERELTPLEYARRYHPRFPGLPQTAPAYDSLVTPQQAPYPAACIQSAKECRCYTQQGTRLEVPLALCASIVERGFFVDWHPPVSPGTPPAAQPSPVVPLSRSTPTPVPSAPSTGLAG